MTRHKAPCKDCERRKLGCHGRCEPYKEWKKELDAENKARTREYNANKMHRRKVK